MHCHGNIFKSFPRPFRLRTQTQKNRKKLFLAWVARMNQKIIGSFSKDDSDGNRNGKKAIKQQLCSYMTFLCLFFFFFFFFCRHCTTTTWKCPISRFVEDVNTKERLSFYFPELPYRFKSRKICEIKFEAGRVHFLVTFSQASPSLLPKLPSN